MQSIMSPNTCWLDFRRGGPGPFLVERNDVYRCLHSADRLVILIRGDSPASFAGAFCRTPQVHLLSAGDGLLLAECALHLQQNITKVKASPDLKHNTLHPLQSWRKSADVSQSLYALALAPMSTAVIFCESEFGGIGVVIRTLGTWVRQLMRSGATIRFRPQIVVFCRQLPQFSGDLEHQLTVEVLASCNPTKELTFQGAKGIWRAYFAGIVPELTDLASEADVCHRAVALSDNATIPVIPRKQFIRLLRSAAAHLSQQTIQPLNVLYACRLFPMAQDMARQVEVLFQHAAADGAILTSASLLVARALAVESHQAGMEGLRPSANQRELPYEVLTNTRFPTRIRLRWAIFASSIQAQGTAGMGDVCSQCAA